MRGVRGPVLLVACALALGVAAPASGAILLTADATLDRGYVRLGITGSTSLRDVHVGELVRGRYRELRALNLTPVGTFAGFGELGREQVPRAARWRCDRLERRFLAYGTNAAGGIESSGFSVRTPACANRLRLSVPPRARHGRVRITLEDTWTRGDVSGRLCRRAPGARRRCRRLRVPSHRREVSRRVALPRDGRWRFVFRTAHQTIRRAVAVGVEPRAADLALLPGVLATGDSLMQGLDAVLEDRLTGLATVDTDVRIGSGLTRRVNGDWTKLPRRQVRELRPAATVLFLGGNDGATLRRPDGSAVACCGEPWRRTYAKRVRRAMRAYVRGGRRVYWLALPAARDGLRTAVNAAVNSAILRASRRVKRATVLDMVSVFTPGGRYTETITHRGRRVRVRQGDGIHLTTRGAEIAATIVIEQLERDGVL